MIVSHGVLIDDSLGGSSAIQECVLPTPSACSENEIQRAGCEVWWSLRWDAGRSNHVPPVSPHVSNDVLSIIILLADERNSTARGGNTRGHFSCRMR